MGLTDSFEAVEQELGLQLPVSFKELTNAYGTGVWFATIFVLNPFEQSPIDGGRWWCRRGYAGGPAWCDALRASRDRFPSLHAHPIFPEPGGIFPWAFLQDGGVLYWLTEGPPDGWRTLDERDLPSSPESWESYKMSVTEILLKLAIDVPEIRDRELQSRCHPYRDRGFEAARG